MLISVLPGNIWMISKTFKKILCGLTRQHFFTPLYVWVMSVHHWGSWENNNSSSSKSQINFKTTQIVWEIIESLFLMHILQLLYILLWSIFFTKWYLFIRDGFSSFLHVGEARGGWCQHFSEQRRHCDRKEVHGCSWFTDWEDHGCQHHGSLLGQSVKDMDKSPHDFTSRLDNTVIFNLALTSPVDSLVEFKNEYDLFCYSRWFGLFPPPPFSFSPQTYKAFLPAMIANNHGHLVSIASSAGLIGVNGLAGVFSSLNMWCISVILKLNVLDESPVWHVELENMTYSLIYLLFLLRTELFIKPSV